MKILLVDDDQEILEELVEYFAHLRPTFDVSTATDGQHAWSLLTYSKFDVVLTDIRMPLVNGLELLELTQTLSAPPPVVLITNFDADDMALQGIAAGAAGYIVKTDSPNRIVAAIEDAVDGGTTVSPQVLTRLKQLFPPLAPAPNESIRAKLTEKEAAVLDLVAQGLSNRQIAESTGRSVPAVKKTTSALMGLFGVQNRSQLAIAALQR